MCSQVACRDTARRGAPEEQKHRKEAALSTVKPRLTLRPGGNPEAAPLIGLETYDPDAAIALLQTLEEGGDEEEQRATLEFLIKALNESRPEGFRLFPESDESRVSR